MSWPADGLPRYVAVEAGRTVLILDRAHSHRRVAEFHCGRGTGRRDAAARLAELNGAA